MPESRKRRIIRRVVLTITIILLLPTWYVSAWVGVSRAGSAGFIPFSGAEATRPAFQPLIGYCESDLPGSQLLFRFWWAVNQPAVVKFRGVNAIQVPPLSPLNRPILLNPSVDDEV